MTPWQMGWEDIPIKLYAACRLSKKSMGVLQHTSTVAIQTSDIAFSTACCSVSIYRDTYPESF